MQIHEVTLRNIRSYEDFSIEFQEGITLLSGDIGAGKSSILQAIEFSLFGIQRGGLEGESLLRHGADEGHVSVSFSINDKEVSVRRTLKRMKDGVRQTEALLSIDGSQEALSAVELKARILELLGYPEQLLTKSKGLIFRHTVYTPQEEMKHILFMPVEDRLNTLRILFGIDKYKTIKENTQLFLKEIRLQERSLNQAAALVPSLEREREEQAIQAASTLQLSQAAETAAEQAKAAVQEKRQVAAAARTKWEAAMRLEHERQTLNNRVKELERNIINAQEDIQRVQERLDVQLHPVHDRSADLENLHSSMKHVDEQLIQATRQLAELRAEHKFLEQPLKEIAVMDVCPTCKQQVTPGHKHSLELETTKRLSLIETDIGGIAGTEEIMRKQRITIQEQLNQLNEHQRKYAAYQKEAIIRKDQELQRERYHHRIQEMNQELELTGQKLKALPLQDTESQVRYDSANKALQQAEDSMHEKISLLAQAKDNHSKLQAHLQLIEERLQQAKQATEQLAKLQGHKQWLEDKFIELVSVIEQHVLASIHAEFRELFQTWFAKLVEDETIQVSLGEQFEPIVTQNGYDASLEQLSGGEKTAVALAYRLSLYRVVSDFIAAIHTKDLLILDEPTDGFSTEQLDKVKEVLRELGCSQVILVSHETQMEGLCDHVLRVQKSHHRSGF